MLGTPWFWRVYLSLIFAAVIAMRVTGYQLPEAVRQVGLSTIVGQQAFGWGVTWKAARLRGAHKR